MEQAIEDAFWIRPGKKGRTWAMRVPVDGQRRYLTLGHDYGPQAMSERAARFKCGQVLGQIELGMFEWPVGGRLPRGDAQRAPAAGAEDRAPRFVEIGEKWYERELVTAGRTRQGLTESGKRNKRWLLNHVLTVIGEMPLDQIDEGLIEDFAIAKREMGYAAVSVSKMLNAIEKIVKSAIRRRLIDRNPVDGYRLPTTKFIATHLFTAAQIEALLEAAYDQDLLHRGRRGHGYELLSALVFAGLRIGEALALCWKDVFLTKGYLYIRGTKTDNAERRVELCPRLHAVLTELKARRSGQPNEFVFATSKGGCEHRSNVSKRLLRPAVTSANAKLVEQDEEPIGEGLTPHGLRHTYASAMLELDVNPVRVAGLLGHADKGFTLNRYGKPMRNAPGDKTRLERLYRGEVEGRHLKAVA